jgi:hypothetical protein
VREIAFHLGDGIPVSGLPGMAPGREWREIREFGHRFAGCLAGIYVWACLLDLLGECDFAQLHNFIRPLRGR